MGTKHTNTILQGDCITLLQSFPDESIDAIFADPPYFMQTEGELLRTDGSKFSGVTDDWDKYTGFEEYDAFSKAWLAECKRVLKKDGTIWVIGSFQNIYRVGNIMQNLGFWILNDIIWSKPNAVPNFGGTRFQNSHEILLWCSKGKKNRYTFNYKTMKHLNGGKQDKSVWNIGICIGAERIKGKDGKKVHSTQKPEALLRKVILSSTKPGDVILDPFFGTGTTGAVAKMLGRNWIGIERDKNYIEVAQKRIDAVGVEDDEVNRLSLEVKPPRVSMAQLVQAGYIKAGDTLYDKNGVAICQVTDSGQVMKDDQTMSIHKMSAQQLGKTNHNGWSFFQIKDQDGLLPIDDLRYRYVEETA
ncbi:MAG TPA: site-specific DNA-methyltransferase [Candidatus Saccharimonadales bacterium]|nr:site-specific DNA-methyltransferase [Candidatus Saccharimonadales bacterium]